MAVGAEGVISVASNIIPKQISNMVNLYSMGKSSSALKIHQKYYSIFKDLFIETNPVPIKLVCSLLDKCCEEYRLPLCKMSSENRKQLVKTLKSCGLI